jgi:ABC-type bacteriocin/lantibiotic exporter with double-glycine peptidase domain
MSNILDDGISLRMIASRYRFKVSVTWVLLVVEAVLMLLFPLAIGYAVDGLMEGGYREVIFLVVLCALMLVFGAGRRFWDTRAYAQIYQQLAGALVVRHAQQNVSTAVSAAQVSLLSEVVEFFEEYIPELLAGIIAFLGVLLLLSAIDIRVFALCLAASVLVVLVYALSSKLIQRYNTRQNDELERQVDVISAARKRAIDIHFRRLMKWNIKLSDLETVCFSLVWLILSLLLVASTVLIVENPAISAGSKLTSIMYIFQYMEVVMGFPLIYQQLLRLFEINDRLSQTVGVP